MMFRLLLSFLRILLLLLLLSVVNHHHHHNDVTFVSGFVVVSSTTTTTATTRRAANIKINSNNNININDIPLIHHTMIMIARGGSGSGNGNESESGNSGRRSCSSESTTTSSSSTTTTSNNKSDDGKALASLSSSSISSSSSSVVEETTTYTIPSSSSFSLLKSKSRSSSSLSYHLLYTKGFIRKFILSTMLLYFIHNNLLIINKKFNSFSLILSSLSLSSSNLLSSVGLPLLASSCCLLQLIVNILIPTIGCLGLNTTLGPIRPYFMSILVYITTLQINHNNNLLSLKQFLLRFSITLLPELVDIWNNYTIGRRRKTAVTTTSTTKTASATTGADDDDDNTMRLMMITATVEYDIPTMGCVACINKIDSSLNNNDSDNDDARRTKKIILDVKSWLDSDRRPKGGTTQIKFQVKSKEDAHIVSQQMIEKFKQIGFGQDAKIIKLELSSSSDEAAEGPSSSSE